ncbi:plasmodesmata callose-binding protein 5 [Capsicum annuum]|uniref:Plasmodesmata callose-binding protein 5 n=1 Tax=Capsicum annuum TaxID=4072 RepID=A0A2G2ZP91_CAPAN|nr:plasmodesmata callose-binding protein 5 [Capsicum annuum]PHT83775.1 plasmodesmata callose-binding protein 5 [Capsicum annuum]
MTLKVWIFLSLLVMKCFVVLKVEGMVQEKEDATIPMTSLSPPEGNITFLGGTTWCVARAGAPQLDLQNALDWACGLGMADCRPIQAGGPCFEPNTLLSHASFAFNNYYQQNGNSDIACNFGGTAMLTKINPSHEKCIYATSGPRIEDMKSAAPPFSKESLSIMWLKIAMILLLMYSGS